MTTKYAILFTVGFIFVSFLFNLTIFIFPKIRTVFYDSTHARIGYVEKSEDIFRDRGGVEFKKIYRMAVFSLLFLYIIILAFNYVGVKISLLSVCFLSYIYLFGFFIYRIYSYKYYLFSIYTKKIADARPHLREYFLILIILVFWECLFGVISLGFVATFLSPLTSGDFASFDGRSGRAISGIVYFVSFGELDVAPHAGVLFLVFTNIWNYKFELGKILLLNSNKAGRSGESRLISVGSGEVTRVGS